MVSTLRAMDIQNVCIEEASFVFDLGEIIYGMESWWSIINAEEDLRDITDKDINSIWYMKALRELSKD